MIASHRHIIAGHHHRSGLLEIRIEPLFVFIPSKKITGRQSNSLEDEVWQQASADDLLKADFQPVCKKVSTSQQVHIRKVDERQCLMVDYSQAARWMAKFDLFISIYRQG